MAQLDNATDSDSGERGFKSLRAGHRKIRECKTFSDFSVGSLSIRTALKVSVKKTVLWTVFSELRLSYFSNRNTPQQARWTFLQMNVLRAAKYPKGFEGER